MPTSQLIRAAGWWATGTLSLPEWRKHCGECRDPVQTTLAGVFDHRMRDRV